MSVEWSFWVFFVGGGVNKYLSDRYYVRKDFFFIVIFVLIFSRLIK